jgi:uncharacterized membrane protein
LFETVAGLPAHPLLVHAPIVLIPLLIALAIVYAVVPFLRGRIRWAVTLLAVVAPVSAWLAKLSGEAFRRRLMAKGVAGEMLTKINNHKSFGDATLWAAIALGVVTLLLVAATMNRLPVRRTATSPEGQTGTGSAGTGSTGAKVLRIVLIVATIGLAVATGYYVFKTGDSGARMEWEGR